MNKINVTMKIWNVLSGEEALVTSYEEADRMLADFNTYPNAEGFNFLSIKSSDGQVNFEVLISEYFDSFDESIKDIIMQSCEKYRDKTMPKDDSVEEGWAYQWSLLARVIDRIEFA
ncbi:hypothetical protein ACQKK5_24630 [Brevibacillus panacihumi]|uniref:hypothetical protein n=1 Tax=Brevibacillus panacihumi TaxID=497735 RepID=UPI003D03C22C